MLLLLQLFLFTLLSPYGDCSWSGHLYHLSGSRGRHNLRSFTRRSVKDGQQNLSLRLVLTPDTSPNPEDKRSTPNSDPHPTPPHFDLEVARRSAWTEDSVVMIRRGDTLRPAKTKVNPDCFYSGNVKAIGQEGVVSVHLCHPVSGLIETRSAVYRVQETSEKIGSKKKSPLGRLKVEKIEDTDREDTMRRSVSLDASKLRKEKEEDEAEEDNEKNHRENDMIDDEEVISVEDSFPFHDLFDEEDRDKNEKILYKNSLSEERGVGHSSENVSISDHEERKRIRREDSEYMNVAMEVGVYLDLSYFMLLSRLGFETDEQKINFVVHHWAIIKNEFANPKDVGMIFDVQLKYIELWKDDPSFYSKTDIFDRLHSFCRARSKQNFDQRTVYSYIPQSWFSGLAYVGTICIQKKNCATLNSFRTSLALHELGHNLGLNHDIDTTDGSPRGFMSHTDSVKWLDSYRRKLLRNVPKRECLFTKDVDLEVLNK